MSDILKKIEALLIEEGVIPEEKPAQDEPVKSKKVIDTDFAIQTGHKMEFSDSLSFTSVYVSPLTSHDIDEDYLNGDYLDEAVTPWDYCRYLQDEWLINPNMLDRGCKQILPDGLKVEVLLHNSTKAVAASQNVDFSFSDRTHHIKLDDIYVMAYRILGPAEGWKYEWEEE